MIDVRATLKQAADAYKAGDKAAAQRLCLDILTVDPTHPDTLFLSSFLTDIPNRQVTLLQMALERDPNHARARARLDKLQAAGAVPHGSPSAPSSAPISQTPAFNAPIESVPPNVASPVSFPPSPTRPPITPLPSESSVARPAGAEPAGRPRAAPSRRRGSGSTLVVALLVIVLVIIAAGVALTLLNRQNQAAVMPTAVPNIVLVTRTPLPTQAPSETPSATATLAATTQAIAGVATVPVAARTGPGSPSQPVPLGTPFTLALDGAPVLTLRVDEVIRGDEAARRIAQASPLNPELPQGYEYVLLRIVARLDPDAERLPVRPRDFVGSSQGALYPIDAEFLYPPSPDLDTSFGSPGTETTGWVIVWVPAGDAAPLVQFSNPQWPDGVYFATR